MKLLRVLVAVGLLLALIPFTFYAFVVGFAVILGLVALEGLCLAAKFYERT